MALEIERKFLLKNDNWRKMAKGKRYKQGYIKNDTSSVVRVRIAGRRAFLTIKAKVNATTRLEYEYRIPRKDAEEMLHSLCKTPLIDKTRFVLKIDNLIWEIDEFYGDNDGLIIAEVELESEDQKITLPEWIGKEVTDDPRYYNANLAEHPFKDW